MFMSEDEIEKLVAAVSKVAEEVSAVVDLCVRAEYVLRELEREVHHAFVEHLSEDGKRGSGCLMVESEKVSLIISAEHAFFQGKFAMLEDVKELSNKLALHIERPNYTSERSIPDDEYGHVESPIVPVLILKHLIEGGAERLIEGLEKKIAEIKEKREELEAPVEAVKKAIAPLVLARKT